VQAPAEAIDIFLQPGEFYFGEGHTRIRTLLGSCVAITLWHPGRRIGGMCHYLLPRRPRGTSAPVRPLDGRYAEDAFRMFLRELLASGTSAADYQVKLFGGARMLEAEADTRHRAGIAERNVEFGRAAIAEGGFRLCAEDLGGRGHRNIALDLWSGDVWVRWTGLRGSHPRGAA
jgi:chemotaxis protein CheD